MGIFFCIATHSSSEYEDPRFIFLRIISFLDLVSFEELEEREMQFLHVEYTSLLLVDERPVDYNPFQ